MPVGGVEVLIQPRLLQKLPSLINGGGGDFISRSAAVFSAPRGLRPASDRRGANLGGRAEVFQGGAGRFGPTKKHLHEAPVGGPGKVLAGS
jgi:hypothetical protein